MTMCGILDKAEARGEFNFLYNQIKKGILTIEQAAKSINISVEQVLDDFKEYNLVL